MALLVNEPWLLKPWEIRRLTLAQIFDCYLWPRDEQGRLVFDPPAASGEQTPREWFFRLWRLRRLPDYKIEAKWREWCKANGIDILSSATD